jgi:hypothetical protein
MNIKLENKFDLELREGRLGRIDPEWVMFGREMAAAHVLLYFRARKDYGWPDDQNEIVLEDTTIEAERISANVIYRDEKHFVSIDL